MSSKQQQLAQTRNWSKFRLSGLNFPREGLTENELNIIQAIKNLQGLIMRHVRFNPKQYKNMQSKIEKAKETLKKAGYFIDSKTFKNE
jgi:hypothetical protein